MFSVIFDMDGTLLDTQRIFISSWDWAGERQGIKNLGSHVPAVCGSNDAGWMKYLKDNFPRLDLERFVEENKQYVVENLVVKYKKGAEEMITLLKGNGVKIALASGSSHPVIAHHLEKVGGANYFDVIVGGMDVQNGKPAPDIFLLAAEKLGVTPEDCYVIEDSANGIRAGFAAGMKCIGIPDLVQFDSEVKAMMTGEFASMTEAADFFKTIL